MMFKQFPVLMLLPFLQSCFQFGGPKLLWQASIASETTPIVQDGIVYVSGFRAGHPEEPYRVFALDAASGAEKWVSVDSVEVLYGPSGGYVFFRNKAGNLVQLNAQTGEKFYESADSETPLLNWVIQSDIMFIVNNSYEVVAVDNRQSKVLWRMKLPFKTGDDTALQVAGPNVIVSGNFRNSDEQFGMIWALDAASGAERWHFEVPPPRDYDPLAVLVYGPYIVATNTAPTVLHTYVLDVNTGKELYPPIGAFDFKGYLDHLAYASNGTFDLRTGQRTEGIADWISGSVLYKGFAWKRRLSSVGAVKAFTLRTEYDGDYRGRRDWTNTPPNSSLEGFDVKTGKSRYKTKEYQYTRFSMPVEAGGVLFHTSIALMKEGKSGVWAYRLPEKK